MFVRFRETARRLQVSIVVARREGTRVHQQHLASLGSIPRDPDGPDRYTFWTALHRRLAQLDNRIPEAERYEILGQIAARIPMVTADEVRKLQAETADRMADHFRFMGRHLGAIGADQAGLARMAEATARESEEGSKGAMEAAGEIEARASAIRARTVAGPIERPWTRERFALELEVLPAAIDHLVMLADLPRDVLDATMATLRADGGRRERADFRAALRIVLAERALKGGKAAAEALRIFDEHRL